eukprot:6654757-Pyramimonas_sp.AAC.1
MAKAGRAEEKAPDAIQEGQVANLGARGRGEAKDRAQARVTTARPGRSREAAREDLLWKIARSGSRRSRNARNSTPVTEQATGPGALNARASPGRQW